jgi:(S)-2-hydroxyglutarate dehydrogenase
MIYDYCVIGAGIVGIATAYQLKTRYPTAKIIIIEKEKQAAAHQTGRNSGVVHAGIYYKAGSLKSTFCKQGLTETYRFAEQHSIPFNKTGKLIVATNDKEAYVLEKLYQDRKDELNISLLSRAEVSSIEPNLKANSAILSPETGIIDWQQFAQRVLQSARKKGVELLTDATVTHINETSKYVEMRLSNFVKKIRTKKLICCAGLQSDRLVMKSGLQSDVKIIPFKGTYFYLNKDKSNIFKKLIYPTPDLETPFLGIHFTKHINGSVSLGPSASLSLSREGYNGFVLNINDSVDTLFYKGFWKFLIKQKKFIVNEAIITISKLMYLRQCKKFYDGISVSDIQYSKCGIRAQAVDRDGNFVNDFLFASSEKILHVLNAPSPAATSCFPIANYILNKAG